MLLPILLPPTHAEVATDAGGKEGAEAEAVEGGRVGCTTELELGTSAILAVTALTSLKLHQKIFTKDSHTL